jgi:hypothetical protein
MFADVASNSVSSKIHPARFQQPPSFIPPIPDKIRRPQPEATVLSLERVKGIEPSHSAWKADVLPLNYTRMMESV